MPAAWARAAEVTAGDAVDRGSSVDYGQVSRDRGRLVEPGLVCD